MNRKPTTESTSSVGAPSRAGRSPSYPMLSLPEAIEKTRQLWDALRKNAVSPKVASQALGYTGISGTSGRTISALIQYGLMSEEGKGDTRTVKITEDGRAVAILERGDAERERIIRTAAVRPRIFSEMVARWPETLPPEAEMRRYLTFEKNFNQDTVHEVIKSFRKTYEFAHLGMLIDSIDEDEAEGEEPVDTLSTGNNPLDAGRDTNGEPPRRKGDPFHTPPDTGFTSYTLPLTVGKLAYLQVPAGISRQDFKLLTLGLRLIEASVVDTAELPDFDILDPPKVRQGPAIWRSKEGDHSVVVTGYLGVKDDRHYVTIEGSKAGIPLDELSYETDQ